MKMSLLDLFLNGIRVSDDVIDAEFILSDLYEVDESEMELYQGRLYDALTSERLTHQGEQDNRTPIGKMVR